MVSTNGNKTLCDQIHSGHIRGELDVEDFSLLMAVAFILSLFTFFFFNIKNFITKKCNSKAVVSHCEPRQFSITFNTKLDSHRSHNGDPKAL